MPRVVPPLLAGALLALLVFGAADARSEDATSCLRGLVARSEGIDAAIAHFDRCLRDGQLSNSMAAIAHDLRGLAHQENGALDKAIADFDAAIALDPPNGGALYHRGNAFLHGGEYARAAADFAAVIELDPRSAGAYLSRGIAFAQLGDAARAISDYDRAIALGGADSLVYLSRGLAHASAGDQHRALADIDEAIRLGRADAESYRARSTIHVRLGDVAAGIADLEQAIALAPDNAAVYNDLAWLLATKPHAAGRDRKRVLRLAEKAMALAPDDPDIMDTLAAAYADAGNFDGAAAMQEKAIAAAQSAGVSQDIVAEMRLRLAYYRQGKPWRE